MADDPLPFYSPGKVVTLETDSGQRYTFTVERLFTPLTKSVVVLACCADLSPDPVVLKIYDPRFFDERNGVPPNKHWEGKPSHPWSLAAERAAPATIPYDQYEIFSPGDPPAADDAEGQLAYAALHEAHYRRLMTDSFAVEHAAYEHLQHLQGTTLPRLLASGRTIPPDERAFIPPAIALEYIAGPRLRDAPLDALTPDVCTALVRAVDSFAAHGVIHDDFSDKNILVAPSRAVVVDFGNAGVRGVGYDWTDEEWKDSVSFCDDDGAIRYWLKRKGVAGMDELLKHPREGSRGIPAIEP
ncbi:hypothetical protein K525DRAFT_241304 [Schizophyllum commune Loenen D]|nr:hypothetical protein K525DRAFT_241304 [Schizophyllum commune Loenen D]